MKNKTAFITGGNAGIGLATAIEFAKRGANVAIMGRRDSENQKALTLIQKDGTAIAFTGDVSKKADIQKAVDETVKKFGALHYAFNNAGVEEIGSPLSDKSDANFDKIMNINVKGVLLSMQTEIPHMLKAGGGSIVNTSSILGLVAMAQVPIYTASKHAVIGLTKSVALEFAKQNIRVNSIAPGAIETRMLHDFAANPQAMEYIKNMHPLGRIGTPEEIAKLAVWLCSDEASFVTGQVYAVDGGFTAQ